MKFLFAGVGALGSRFGYMLFNQGEDVTFVDTWQPHIDKIKSEGLEVIIDGKHLGHINIPVYRPENLSGQFDVVFLATKSMELPSMMRSIKHLVHDNTKFICVLNGLGHVDTLKQFVREEQILIGVTLWTSGLGGPGILNAVGTGKTDIKQVKEVNMDETFSLIERLNKAGFNMIYSSDTLQAIWHKVGLNCVLNSYCTLIDCNINQYGNYQHHLELTRAVLDEVVAVGQAEGIDVQREVIEKNIEHCFNPQTAGLHHPSLYQDMHNGRLTEIDYLNGAIVKLGEKHGIATPVCQVITLMIHSKEQVNGNK